MLSVAAPDSAVCIQNGSACVTTQQVLWCVLMALQPKVRGHALTRGPPLHHLAQRSLEALPQVWNQVLFLTHHPKLSPMCWPWTCSHRRGLRKQGMDGHRWEHPKEVHAICAGPGRDSKSESGSRAQEPFHNQKKKMLNGNRG